MSGRVLVDEKFKYRDHYIQVRIVADGFGSNMETGTAVVNIYDGLPPGGRVLSFGTATTGGGDVIYSFEEEVPRFDYEGVMTDMMERAKYFVDAQQVNEQAAKEAVQIASERTLGGESC